MSQVIDLLSPIARNKGLELTWRRAPGVARRVRGDLGRLRQILINLIGNALKYTEQGSVNVLVEPSADEQEGDRAAPDRVTPDRVVVFRVVDTGIGIPEALQQHLFRPFTQADDSPTRRFGGTGLGLAIASQLCELMGGTIHVTSTPGLGSTFRFTVPLAEPVGEIATEGDEIGEIALPDAVGVTLEGHLATASSTRPETPSSSDRGPSDRAPSDRILVVEDNAINQRVLVAMLKNLGYQSDVAANGREAVGMLEKIAYRAVFMDCWMPVLDGYQATEEIRRQETSTSRVPVIALTGSALPEERDRAQQAGMDDFVTKPITLETMRQLLERWCPLPAAQ
jgi:CheY-like chemotaxis protein